MSPSLANEVYGWCFLVGEVGKFSGVCEGCGLVGMVVMALGGEGGQPKVSARTRPFLSESESWKVLS